LTALEMANLLRELQAGGQTAGVTQDKPSRED
jgi:hypothetical protein